METGPNLETAKKMLDDFLALFPGRDQECHCGCHKEEAG